MSDYGRYIDEKDGMPRWNLPPKTSRYNCGERGKMIEEAVIELYADHGAAYVRERLGEWVSNDNIRMRAYRNGLHVTESARERIHGGVSAKLKRLVLAERARLLRGMEQQTELKVEWEMRPSGWAWRGTLHRRYGYIYGNPPYEMLYDGNSRRRLPPLRRKDSPTEEDLARKYGFVFKPMIATGNAQATSDATEQSGKE